MDKFNNGIQLSFGPLGGWLLSLGIVLARAFQPNAEPLSTWSKTSWFWMTSPIWGPVAFGVIMFICWFIGWIVVNIRNN